MDEHQVPMLETEVQELRAKLNQANTRTEAQVFRCKQEIMDRIGEMAFLFGKDITQKAVAQILQEAHEEVENG